MKRIRIKEGFVGLVFKKENFKRVIKEGTHWLTFGEKVIRYNKAESFNGSITSTDILLKNKDLVAMWHVIEVTDNQLVLVFKNNIFNQVLTVGRYIFWNDLIKYTFTKIDTSKIYITEEIDKNLLSSSALSSFVRTFEVAAFEKAVLLVDDVFIKILTAGTYRFWKNHTSIKVEKIDTRKQQMEITGQELLTKDKATIRINFTAQYQVINVEKALLENNAFKLQLYTALQLALRAFVGAYTLDELLENKNKIAKAVFEDTKIAATKLGVVLIASGMKDIILTGEMKTIMNQVIIAQKQAQAHVITRREETASTRSLLNTAKLMEENTMLFKLKEMEYVEKIADKIGEITLNGNGGIITQLKDIFTNGK